MKNAHRMDVDKLLPPSVNGRVSLELSKLARLILHADGETATRLEMPSSRVPMFWNAVPSVLATHLFLHRWTKSSRTEKIVTPWSARPPYRAAPKTASSYLPADTLMFAGTI